MINETALVRVYFPEVTASDSISSLGIATYNNATVQDVIDEGGPLYLEKDFKGNDKVCMVGIYGSMTLTGTFGGRVVSPLLVEPVWFVRGRPDDRR